MKPILLGIAIALSPASFSAVARHLESQLPAVNAIAAAAATPEAPVPENAEIDYEGFVNLTQATKDVRAQRRVPVEAFMKMAKGPNTVILDTRSKAAYDNIHIDGAIHLNFSDFTAEKLAKVIPDKKTRILIYCNNNFLAPNNPSLLLKSRPLALNIPTFVNLRGYGYENVYELANLIALGDKRVPMAGRQVK